MAEQAGAALGQTPVLSIRPERGKFVSEEPGAHAHLGVMPRYGTAADQPERVAAKIRAAETVRFHGHE